MKVFVPVMSVLKVSFLKVAGTMRCSCHSNRHCMLRLLSVSSTTAASAICHRMSMHSILQCLISSEVSAKAALASWW
uniref:Secreted protein n=1 Tax=Echinococcus granulosus TaxID=6210 RepID=A0A068X2W4_ECHGR|nr:hypothetical protein EgrG_002063800 [Echinococcus granulosus]